jgi:hypothetical protein
VFWLRPEHPLGDGAVGHAVLVSDGLAGHSPCGRKSLPSANSKGAVLVPIVRCGHSAGQDGRRRPVVVSLTNGKAFRTITDFMKSVMVLSPPAWSMPFTPTPVGMIGTNNVHPPVALIAGKPRDAATIPPRAPHSA